MQFPPNGRKLPRITIFAESGPLAGDLAACLSGHFDIGHVTSVQAALDSVALGCQALLILEDAQEGSDSARRDLIKYAAGNQCRILILGSGGLSPESGSGTEVDLDANIVRLPPLPSPQVLYQALAGLERGMQAGSA